jgi:type IV secretion system protein VirD4
MWISSLLRAVVAGGLQERNKVHFVLDEMSTVGHLDCIDDAIDKFRGYGVRLQIYLQGLGQLKKCFPQDQGQTALANTTQVYFSANSLTEADLVSSRLGESTVVVDSGGRSYGSSSQWSESTQPSTGGGSNSGASTNWGQQARKLLTPDEVLALPPRTAITFVPGMRPIRTTLLRYYEEKASLWRKPGLIRRSLDACAMLVVSFAMCFSAGYFAYQGVELVSQHLARKARHDSQRPIERKSTIKPRPGVPAFRR